VSDEWLITMIGILQKMFCLYISNNLLVFPENMGPMNNSRYPDDIFVE
jgi:hypothetical protein